jgi:uncharacterized repeat protein (TIGR01451 family)
MLRKKQIAVIFLIAISLFSISIHFREYNSIPLSNRVKNDIGIDNLYTSDIAGTDLYAENIDVFLAGDKSIIKQSFFSNDTSILPQFDTRDPAFFKCNLLFSVSNGIIPEVFPNVITENDIPLQFSMTFNSFSGFLYYDESLSQSEVEVRADRALEILKRKFEIDLITVESTNPYFFPFIGYFPNWNVYMREIIGNLPMDGYWKALDVERLTSDGYLNSNHLSSSFLLINSLDLLEKDFLASIDQINFNIESLDLSFLESFNVESIFEQFTNVLLDYPAIFGNFTDLIGNNESDTDMAGLIDVFEGFTLSNQSNYVNLMVQYEGTEEGITEGDENEYEFNLWNALNYKGDALRPSEKVFISLIGAFISNINLNIMCTEITDMTPKYFDLYSFLLEQLDTILFYAEVDFDVSSLEDYSLELFWVDYEGIKRNFVKPVNLNDPEDYVNFLSIIGFQGIEGVPAGILNPIADFTVSYVIGYDEPSILIKKDLIGDNTSYGVYNTFSFNITAENVGNNTVWGNPTKIPIDLDDAFSLIVGPVGIALNLDEDLKDAIWEIVRVVYSGEYSSLEDFFNFDEDPRIFYFDTTGAGVIDYYFPDLLNLTNLYPFNEKMENVINIMTTTPEYIALLDSLAAPLVDVSVNDLRTIFGNNESIWNEQNWYLNPGEKIFYEFSNFSIEGYDSFTPFYNYSFLIRDSFPNLPYIISGNTISGTTPQMASENDDDNWIVESEEKYVGYHEIDIQFLFKNSTAIDLNNNSLDQISILANFSDLSNSLIFEVFNYSSETYLNLNNFSSSETNSTFEFSFERNEGSLEWIFDPYTRENHSILVRVRGSNPNKFNISINNIDIQFSYRDVNVYQVLGSRIIHNSMSGNIEYIRRSNTITLSTYSMASIIAYGYLNKYCISQGELFNYQLTLQNVGTEIAHNVNVSLLIPGIINEFNGFSFDNNTLTYFVSELIPYAEIQLNFSFYSPNTAKISSISIEYENNETIANINSTDLTAIPNEVFFSSPIDYKTRFPYVKTIEIYMSSSNISPQIGELFNITIGVKNTGLEGFNISSLTIQTGDKYGDLYPHNLSSNLIDIEYNYVKSFVLTLNKTDWKAYLYPSINYFESSESKIIQIKNSESIILGTINFTIIKSVDKNHIEVGEIISVNITVINSGTICLKDVSLQDTISFTGIDFDLIDGNLVNEIPCLHSGETLSFEYQIKAKTQVVVNLKPAFIEQYYLTKLKYQSNEVQVKVIIPKTIQYLFIIGPSVGAFIVIIGFLWQKYKYHSKRYEQQRYELSLFQDYSSTAVLNIEHNLRDYFKSISSMHTISPNDLQEIPKENFGDSNE